MRRPGVNIPGEGEFTVGTQVRPGLYKATYGPDSDSCFSASGTEEEFLDEDGDLWPAIDMIDKEFGGTTIYPQVEARDELFLTDGCSTWQQVYPTDAPTFRAVTAGSRRRSPSSSCSRRWFSSSPFPRATR